MTLIEGSLEQDWRFNPIGEYEIPEIVTNESHEAILLEKLDGLVGFQLNEIALKENPSSLTIVNKTDNINLSETLISPSANEFFYDYKFQTGLVIVNPSQIGKQFEVSYKALGTVNSTKGILNLLKKFLDGTENKIVRYKAGGGIEESPFFATNDFLDLANKDLINVKNLQFKSFIANSFFINTTGGTSVNVSEDVNYINIIFFPSQAIAEYQEEIINIDTPTIENRIILVKVIEHKNHAKNGFSSKLEIRFNNSNGFPTRPYDLASQVPLNPAGQGKTYTQPYIFSHSRIMICIGGQYV